MILTELEAVLADRRTADPEASYTARLLADPELNQRKIMEEAFEVCLELQRCAADRGTAEHSERLAEESADLIYHLLVGLVGADVALDKVFSVLEGRRQ
ncbi:MAG: phosphoribosyl-ATP diphosphatase [Actinomycetota bacterium]